MANPEHLEILKQGVELWNKSRIVHKEFEIDLLGANLGGANLDGADFSKVWLGYTIFAFLDLSTVKGLDNCVHQGASSLDTHTLLHSKNLPEVFLRGCGLPDNLIAYGN